MELIGEWCCSLSFHHRETLFNQLASLVFITSASYCVIVSIRDNTTRLLYADNNNAYCSSFLPRREFQFIVLIWNIISVTAQNNLNPEDTLKEAFQLAVLLVTSTLLVDMVDWRPVACYSWQAQCTRLRVVCEKKRNHSGCYFRTCKLLIKAQKGIKTQSDLKKINK